MLRSMLSVVVVLSLLVAAFLLYGNYVLHEKQPERHAEIETGQAPPPPQPIAPVVTNPVAPIAPQNPPQPISPAPLPSESPEHHDLAQHAPPSRKHDAEQKRGKRTHVVQPGDTLWGISKNYFGTPEQVSKIAEINELQSKTLRVGQVLIIPDGPPPTAQIPIESESESAGAETQEFEPQPPTLNIVRKR